jgi:predicted TIM-barrel fold metal-dependent hydrolase
MPLQEHMNYISVDDHLVEPPMLWQDRLPRSMRDRGPRIVETTTDVADDIGVVYPAGSEAWAFDGTVIPQSAGLAVAGTAVEERSVKALRYSEMRPGCYDPAARLRDMDDDGVYAQLCFPTFARFAGTRFLVNPDRELAAACVRAYNDFAVDEWCAADRKRQIPVAILPLWDIELSRQEVQRVAGRGMRAVSFPENPTPHGLPSLFSSDWNPVWAAIEAAGMPICMHIGTSGSMPRPAPDAPHSVSSALLPVNTWTALISLLYSPMLHHFPDLKISLTEGGVGWIPAALERADFIWEVNRFRYPDLAGGVRPSERFRRNIYGCLLDDRIGMQLRHEIGVDRISFESDFPHADSKWPNDRKYASELLADVPDEEAHQMIELNARAMLNFYE